MRSNPGLVILGISGSLREASSNTALLRALAATLPADARLETCEGLHTLPHFNPDDDIDPPPATVAEFRAHIERADGLVISSPEYAHGVPGVLKNALDWLVSSFEIIDKPIALIDAAEGTEFLRPALVETLRVMNTTLVESAFASVPLRGKKPAEIPALVATGETADRLRAAMRIFVDALSARRAKAADNARPG
jgi:NAD(P)H-dependent FMN reductase